MIQTFRGGWHGGYESAWSHDGRGEQHPHSCAAGKGGAEILPIWIGASEALSISLALNGKTLDRPLTHETMFRALDGLGASIAGVNITELRDGT